MKETNTQTNQTFKLFFTWVDKTESLQSFGAILLVYAL